MARRRFGREEPADVRDRGPVADPESVARTILLTKLTARARSRAELATALAERGVPGDVATRVLDRFGEVGLVDDAAFARAWVESRHSARGLSRRALAFELHRKGLDAEVVREALTCVDDDAEYDAARAVAERRVRRGLPAEPRVRWRQLTALLARRGYSPGLTSRVVADVLAAAADAEPFADASVDEHSDAFEDHSATGSSR